MTAPLECDFTSLAFYQAAIRLTEELYPRTKRFPPHEMFNLGDQIRRALTSVTGNIAEGFGRYTFRDRRCFLIYARGSTCELMSHLTLCVISGILNDKEATSFKSQCQRIRFLINRYLAWLKQSEANERAAPAVNDAGGEINDKDSS